MFAANIGWMFTEHSFIPRILHAKENGFRGVEVAFPYQEASAEEMREELVRHSMPCVLINTPSFVEGKWTGGPGHGCTVDQRLLFNAAVNKAIEYGCKVGTSFIHVMSGVVPEGADKSECVAVFAENLRHALSALEQHEQEHIARDECVCNMTFVIEPINTIDLPSYCCDLDTAMNLIELLDTPKLRLLFDVYHVQKQLGNLTFHLERALPMVAHVQVSQLPGRHEPDDLGEICYPYIFKLLRDQGYDRWIGCEYHPRDGTVEGLAWRESVK